MDLKQIKELMAAMEKEGIKKLMIKEKTGYEIHLERHEEVPSHPVQQHIPVAYPPMFHPPATKESDALHKPVPNKSIDAEGGKEEKPGRYVKSPMVGTYYEASSPDDPSFIKVGDRVEENTVICIIEAMKVMNEVKAGMSGTVAEILVDNAHPVEFGTKIIRIV